MFTGQALGVEMSQRRALCLQVSALGCQKVAGKVTGRQERAPGGDLCPRLSLFMPQSRDPGGASGSQGPMRHLCYVPSPPIFGDSSSWIGDAGVTGEALCSGVSQP